MVITTHNNLLCIGRSGTGKTTCSALRLFLTDVIFKYVEAKKEFKNSGGQGYFEPDVEFLNNSSNLKLIFVSASPVLINEVKQFHKELNENFKNELIKYRSKKNEEEKKEPSGI